MKKITGKVVSLVLALALVVTSFSATFAFAAAKTVSGSASYGSYDDEIYLVNGGSGAKRSVVDAIKVDSIRTTDRSETDLDAEVSSISHSSGDSLVRWSIDDGKVTLTLKDTEAYGKEVLSVLVKGTYTDDDDNKITVKATKTFTVNVLDHDQYVIAKADQAKDSGEGLDELDTFAQTAGSYQDVTVYKPAVGADAKANYSPITSLLVNPADSADKTNKTVLTVSNTSNLTVAAADGTVTVTSGKGWDGTKYTSNATTGSVTFTASEYNEDGDQVSKSKTTFKTQIAKKVDVSALKNTNDDTSKYTIAKADKGSATVLSGVYNDHIKDATSSDEVVVTGAEVVFPTGTASVNVDDKSNVGKISGSVGTLTIGDATVGEVDVDGSVEVTGDAASVGNITAASTTDDNEDGSVTVNSGKTGDIDVKDSNFTITGGTVGNVKTEGNAAGTIAIEPNDDDVNITTGDISADGNVTVTSSNDAKITLGKITYTNPIDVTLSGDTISVKSLDFDYFDGKLYLGDDDAFVGTIPALANAKNATLTTQTDDTDATITGDVSLDTVSVGDATTLTFGGKASIGTLDGDGTVRIGSSKLFIGESAYGVTFKLTDSVLSAGLVAYTATADAVDVEDMNNYGFTVAKSAGNSIDTFKIATLEFAGLQVNKTSARIAKDYSETFTASAYPAGTAIPADAKVEWTFDGNENVFSVTSTGNTATVKTVALDPNFASENEATLTATLVDENGDAIEDYAPAKIALTAIAVPDAVSDTTKDFTVNGAYTFKITSATAPTFSIGTAGVFSSALVAKNGNDYFYKITATGKVGAKAGIYLNGTKLLVATVGAPAFKSDTTSNVTVKGAYTYKITAAAVPTFSIGTAGVFTAQFVSKSGNDYFYKITSVGKTGANAGVYVNGVKVNVATVG